MALWLEVGGLRLAGARPRWFSSMRVVVVQALIYEGLGQARFCLLDMTPPFAGDETVRGGPGEHLAGTGARPVLRVRRNVLGVLPILMNTRACSVRSFSVQIRFRQTRSSSAHHRTQEVVAPRAV